MDPELPDRKKPASDGERKKVEKIPFDIRGTPRLSARTTSVPNFHWILVKESMLPY